MRLKRFLFLQEVIPSGNEGEMYILSPRKSWKLRKSLKKKKSGSSNFMDKALFETLKIEVGETVAKVCKEVK